MSLRWIHENLEAPTCDEECSDIDDSCSDDSYDSDLSIGEEKGTRNEKEINGDRRGKRETRRHPTTTVKFDENGYLPVIRNYRRDAIFIILFKLD